MLCYTEKVDLTTAFVERLRQVVLFQLQTCKVWVELFRKAQNVQLDVTKQRNSIQGHNNRIE